MVGTAAAGWCGASACTWRRGSAADGVPGTSRCFHVDDRSYWPSLKVILFLFVVVACRDIVCSNALWCVVVFLLCTIDVTVAVVLLSPGFVVVRCSVVCICVAVLFVWDSFSFPRT